MSNVKKSAKVLRYEEARAQMLKIIAPGDTIYTILRHVSRSGMMRHVSAYVIKDGAPIWLDGYISAMDLFPRASGSRDALKVAGCGMDAGFSIVYSLGYALFGRGWTCIGESNGARCPSNDHANGDRDYSPHPHSDGGYALRHRWM